MDGQKYGRKERQTKGSIYVKKIRHTDRQMQVNPDRQKVRQTDGR